MKKSFFFIMLFFIISWYSVAFSEEKNISPELQEEIENAVMRPFFNAMKNGNTQAIKRYITGKKYDEARIMLDDDKDYPAFLREYYKDAIFSIENGVLTDGGIVVDILIEFPNGGRQTTQFYLQNPGKESGHSVQVAGERQWKISEQRNNRAGHHGLR